jgi:acetyl coenzyme A synthetase (ADP forming)-like protein
MTPGLSLLFAPRSVAVVGASRRAGSVGGAVLKNLLKGGFEGPVFPVNAKAEFVQSVKAYPDLGALPEVPELVVVAVPAAEVIAVVRQAGALGTKAVIVLSAGFAELETGRELERELVEVAHRSSMRLLGPNCLGVQNPDPHVRLDATFATSFAPDGPVAFASQSGALGLAALDYAQDLGIGISAFASLGNKADISGNDILEYLEGDARTRVVLLYFESLGNPTHFREIAARVGKRKPIAMVKSGRSSAGARAAGSHTGAITGPDAAVSALCRQTGIIRAETLEELFDVAMILANQPLPAGRRVGIVTNAGGPGILAADALETAGLSVPRLSAQTERLLASRLPAAASLKNPVDVLAVTDSSAFGGAMEVVLADPAIDVLLTLYVPPITTNAAEIAAALVQAAAGAQKPVLSCFMGTHGIPESLRSLHAGHVPSFRFPEDAARALALAIEHAEWRRAKDVSPRPVPPAPAEATKALARARQRLGIDGGWLSPSESMVFCGAWEIALPAQRVVPPNQDAVLSAALALGLPVVLKAVKADLLHKTEAAAVKVNLASADAVKAAAVDLLRLGPEALVVQRFVAGGDEWLVGTVRDPDYGPLVTAGAGGTWTELWKDVEQRIAPLSVADLDALLARPRIGRALGGWRGGPPRDRASLQRVVERFAFAACAHPEIMEMESNPVIVLDRGAFAVDLRIRIGSVQTTGETK